MVNLLKDSLENLEFNDLNEYDELFIRLKPLQSKFARQIFKIFIDELGINYITTHDIQQRMKKQDIKLSKKEINGWLHYLYNSGFIQKDNIRGKPTIEAYEDKYTFDKWSLTLKGVEIAYEIYSLLKKDINPFFVDSKKILSYILEKDEKTRKQILDHINKTHLKISIIRSLRPNRLLTKSKLRKMIVLSETEFDKFLLDFIKEDDFIKIEKNVSKRSILFFLKMFGYKRINTFFKLTEKGKKIANFI